MSKPSDTVVLEKSGKIDVRTCPFTGAPCDKEGCGIYVRDAGDLSDCAFPFIAKALECIAGRV